jgi:hypothetical protein
MRKVTKWLMAALLALGVLSVQAEPRQAEEQTRFAAVDWKSFERKADRVTLWMTRSYDQTVTLAHGYYPHRSERMQYLIDCAGRTFAIAQWLLTDGAGGSGQVVWHASLEDPPFLPIAGDSFEDAVLHAACSLEAPPAVAKGSASDSSPLLN